MRGVTRTAVALTSETIRRDQGRGSGGRDDERTGTGIVRRPLDLDSVEKQYAFYSHFWCALMITPVTSPRNIDSSATNSFTFPPDLLLKKLRKSRRNPQRLLVEEAIRARKITREGVRLQGRGASSPVAPPSRRNREARGVCRL
jgi:hypothetical protein